MRRYSADLANLCAAFSADLREAPGRACWRRACTESAARWRALLRSCEQLVLLHREMAAAMIALLDRFQGQRLADALGSELLRLSPFLNMHVDHAEHEAHSAAGGQSAFPARLVDDGRSLGLPWARVCHCERLLEADLAEASAALLST